MSICVLKERKTFIKLLIFFLGTVLRLYVFFLLDYLKPMKTVYNEESDSQKLFAEEHGVTNFKADLYSIYIIYM